MPLRPACGLVNRLNRNLLQFWPRGAIIASLTIAAGLFVSHSRIGQPLLLLSYDLPFLARPASPVQDTLILYLDEKSFQDLNQSPDSFDRALYAPVINRLTEDQARLVAFDIWFGDPGNPEANQTLARAMKDNGKVVLAAVSELNLGPTVNSVSIHPPIPILRDAAKAWGIAGIQGSRHDIARRYHSGTDHETSLPQRAARVTGNIPAPATDPPAWLNYYGPFGTLPNLSFSDALQQSPGFFRDKYVFIGSRPTTLHAFQEVEQFRTPYSRVGGLLFPGVTITTTAFLNLIHHNSLHRLAPLTETSLLLLTGLLLGFGFNLLRPWQSLASASLLIAGTSTLALLLHGQYQTWFCSSVLALVQIPLATTATLLLNRTPQTKSTALSPTRPPATPPHPDTLPVVSDHTLLRKIGQGAYGDVWLARNAVGIVHAVKIIYRNRFDNEDPYAREFRGIQKFMPVSRNHPGFVNILHAGHDPDDHYFFYIMETADDVASEQTFDPANYQPKTLASELDQKKQLPAQTCLNSLLTLTDALHHLHQHDLVHRDIKPANIIYVMGEAKIADIGLVTNVAITGVKVTLLGTRGYIAPEGPGSPAADVYSLGKLLYTIALGADPDAFPELPPQTHHQPDHDLLMKLYSISLKACETDLAARYPSAAAMHTDLTHCQ